MAEILRVRTSGLLDSSGFKAWRADFIRKRRSEVAAGLADGARPIVRQVQQRAASVFKLSGQRVPKSIRYKIFDRKPSRMPAVLIGSTIPWMGAHETGATIHGRGKGLLIPLNQARRIGAKAFKRIVNQIIRNGAGFFKNVGGKTILFAEYQPEYGAALARFRRPIRGGLGGGRIKKGADIPIAVLVPQVTLRPRLGLVRTVTANASLFAIAIENRIKQGV